MLEILEIGSLVASLLPEIFEIAGKNLLLLANIIVGVLKGLGIIDSEETPEDLGDKAIQAEEAGVKPEDFDSYEEYVKAVQDFETDPEKSEKIDSNMKVQKGVELTTKIAVERFGEPFIEVFLPLLAAYPFFFDERMPIFTEKFRDNPELLANIARFLKGHETDATKAEESLGIMFDVEKQVNPNATLQQLMNEIDPMKD